MGKVAGDPVGRGDGVIVDQEDDLSRRGLQTDVLRRHDPALGAMEHAHGARQLGSKSLGQLAGRVVVGLPDHDHLRRRHVLTRQAAQAALELCEP
jgi:hypothetical protein